MAVAAEHSLTFNTKFFYYPLRLPWLRIVVDGRNLLTASVINAQLELKCLIFPK